MRFRPVAAYALAASLLFAASAHCVASTTYLGGGWYSGANWSGGTVPTLADDVIIPTGFPTGVILNSATGAKANTITIQGNSRLFIRNDSLEVDGGGNNPSSINAADGLTLDDNNAVLTLSGSQTWAGAGSVQMNDFGGLIEIASGARWIVQLNSVEGLGAIHSISGTATLKLENDAVVVADGGTLVLAQNLALDDSSSSNAWIAFAGTLQFNQAATNLVGEVACYAGGTLDFNADVTTTGLFTWALGVLSIFGADFTYGSYSGECTNPGTGSGPFTIEGPFFEECS
jgi:hypothetical protein